MKTKKKITRSQLTVLIIVFLAFFAVLYFLSQFKFIIDIFNESLVRNLGSYKVAAVTLAGISLLFLGLLILGFFYFISLIDVTVFYSKKHNLWGVAMILTMIFVFIYGVIAYDALYGQEKLSLILRDENGYPAGNIDCNSSEPLRVIIEGQTISCKTSNITIVGGYVNQILRNSSTDYQAFNDSILFTAAREIESIYFYINVKNDSSTYNLSTGNKYYFPTQDEYNELGLKFIKFLILLFGVIFITIPTSFYYMREMFNKK